MPIPTTSPGAMIAGSIGTSVSSTRFGSPHREPVAAASTYSQRGVMTATPKETWLGLIRWTREPNRHLAELVGRRRTDSSAISAQGNHRVEIIRGGGLGCAEISAGRAKAGVRRGHRYLDRPSRRAAFHTSPHARQRQYVDGVTTLLVVVRSLERHAGHRAGAG